MQARQKKNATRFTYTGTYMSAAYQICVNSANLSVTYIWGAALIYVLVLKSVALSLQTKKIRLRILCSDMYETDSNAHSLMWDPLYRVVLFHCHKGRLYFNLKDL